MNHETKHLIEECMAKVDLMYVLRSRRPALLGSIFEQSQQFSAVKTTPAVSKTRAAFSTSTGVRHAGIPTEDMNTLDDLDVPWEIENTDDFDDFENFENSEDEADSSNIRTPTKPVSPPNHNNSTKRITVESLLCA
ncbi:hypothetical protein H2198_000689 [Neophaeococcomyces mojaviensis]|uniref:Uncharacterized protein n=1 Tax=Neophaeococcomyces mojaviensis TaxID=3383035 RepID=A0ACC3AJR6_9EURO|nr:hypothetical protein H2198_000689 [Knufia sp. JES_112]